MERTAETIVAKVGGSLMDLPDLSGRVTEFVARRRGDRLVLIAGGGDAADFVRTMDRMHGLGEAKSHGLAIRSLDLTAHALAAIVPGLVVAETLAEMKACWAQGDVPVLAPRRVLDDDPDPLESSWDVTTDSIAARIARLIPADRLVLVKSTAAEPGMTREQAAERGLVDPRFARESRAIPRVTMINLRDPQGREVELIG